MHDSGILNQDAPEFVTVVKGFKVARQQPETDTPSPTHHGCLHLVQLLACLGPQQRGGEEGRVEERELVGQQRNQRHDGASGERAKVERAGKGRESA